MNITFLGILCKNFHKCFYKIKNNFKSNFKEVR